MRQTPDSPTDFTSPPKLTPALAKRIEHWPLERLIPGSLFKRRIKEFALTY